ncbi:hypothetical protein BDY19DRAFT_416239 [Irpex rosettiformis]|uniref:Uncharacterized protein n=1 Tax=Irpex rosettiformis TaxID=378272 RepID=A0ACB8UFU1_9APHY|nr:hypothetical protein BDY19DRAFT_416239 [Irpex rosettiformis]
MTFIWSSRWSLVKMLYLWTRYSPLLDTILGLLMHFTFLSPEECKLNNSLNSFLLAAGVYSSELVLVWRTFALWHENKRVKYGLLALWLSLFPMGICSLVVFVKSTIYVPQPFTNRSGCNLVDANFILIGDFIGLAVFEIVVVVLTVIKGIHHMRAYTYASTSRLSGGHLLRTLYRDGVVFFVCLTLLSVGNVLAPTLGPRSNALLLPTLLRTAHSALCCRVILHIRSAAAEDENCLSSDPEYPSRITITISTVRYTYMCQL